MDTVEIGGRQVPISEVVAYFAQKDQREQELTTLRQTSEAAKQELARASVAVETLNKAKEDPSFARQLVDTVRSIHADSAFFRDPAGAPPAPPAPTDGTPPVNQPPATPPATPVIGAPAAPVDNMVLQLAQQVEQMQAALNASQSSALVKAKLDAISERFPSLDTEAVLKRAVEEKIDLNHLELLAGDMERDRLEVVVKERETQNSLLDGLLSGGGGANVQENLDGLGLSVSAAQLQGDADVDYSKLDTRDAAALAFAQLGAPEAI